MIFQLDYATVITIVMVSYLEISLILFIAGTYIIVYLKSDSKNKWE